MAAPALQFAALADPTRCRVVELLRERPLAVHALAAAFDISRPAVSRHLRVLREAGIVAEQKQGRENVHALRPEALRAVSNWLGRQGGERAGRIRKAAQPPEAESQMELEL